jgi:hypothetical protein
LKLPVGKMVDAILYLGNQVRKGNSVADVFSGK